MPVHPRPADIDDYNAWAIENNRPLWHEHLAPAAAAPTAPQEEEPPAAAMPPHPVTIQDAVVRWHAPIDGQWTVRVAVGHLHNEPAKTAGARRRQFFDELADCCAGGSRILGLDANMALFGVVQELFDRGVDARSSCGTKNSRRMESSGTTAWASGSSAPSTSSTR